jgi:hypothetical protein
LNPEFIVWQSFWTKFEKKSMCQNKQVFFILFSFFICFSCKKKEEIILIPSVSDIICAKAVLQSIPVSGLPIYTEVSIPYTGGNGVSFTQNSPVASEGVVGLFLKLTPADLAKGNGNFIYSLSGTPQKSGIATFQISFFEKTCAFSINVDRQSPVISEILSTQPEISSQAKVETNYTGTFTVPYLGGNGGLLPAINSIQSTNVKGLTLKMKETDLANGNGNLVFEVSGFPTAIGTATFSISVLGKTYYLYLPVNSKVSWNGSQNEQECKILNKFETIINLAYAPNTGSLPNIYGYTTTYFQYDSKGNITHKRYVSNNSSDSLVYKNNKIDFIYRVQNKVILDYFKLYYNSLGQVSKTEKFKYFSPTYFIVYSDSLFYTNNRLTEKRSFYTLNTGGENSTINNYYSKEIIEYDNSGNLNKINFYQTDDIYKKEPLKFRGVEYFLSFYNVRNPDYGSVFPEEYVRANQKYFVRSYRKEWGNYNLETYNLGDINTTGINKYGFINYFFGYTLECK